MDVVYFSLPQYFRPYFTPVYLAVSDLILQQYMWPFQSIAESLKKGKQHRLTHSRTPSNASSTSAEVAQLTADGGMSTTATTAVTEATTTAATSATTAAVSQEESGARENGANASMEAQLTEVPLDRSEWP